MQKKYDDLEKQLKAAQNELSDLKKQASTNIAQKEKYDEQIDIVTEQIDAVNEEINALQGDINTKEDEVAALTKSIDENYEKFKQRLRAFQTQGEASTLELLLNSESFSDFLAKYTVMQNIADHDKQLMDQLKADKAALSEQKTALEDTKTESEKLKAQLDAKKKENSDLSRQASAMISEIQKDQSAQQKLIEQFDADMEKIERAIDEAVRKSQQNGSVYIGGDFLWPLPSKYTNISSGFGNRLHPILKIYRMHNGIDITAPGGTDIYAANSGTVSAAYNYSQGEYGKYVMIDHGGGVITIYEHCSSVLVSEGDTVTKGQVIAKVGQTGMATGNHLHFGIKQGGSWVNPLSIFKKAG